MVDLNCNMVRFHMLILKNEVLWVILKSKYFKA